MKAKHLLLFLFVSVLLLGYTPTLSGTTYYVSSEGNDAANGLTESTSWCTIAKVNSFSFKAGDMIYFKRGDTWNETLIPSSSGNSSSRITFGSYGTGANPILSGFTTLTGWTNYGGGIYSKAISPQSAPNVLLLDGVNTPLGRTPIGTTPTGWPSNTPQGDTYTYGSMYDAALSGSPSMVGAEIVIRTAYWMVERRTVLTHSGGTVTYGNTSYVPEAGYGYFFQNHINTLDVLGEWCYSGGTIYMFFGSDLPTNHTIKVSTIDALISNTKSYITIDGLTLEGGNAYGISLSGASYNIVKNCTVRYGGNHGIYGINCPYTTIEYNTVNDNNNFGILLNHNWNSSCNNSTISHNTVSNIGKILGMGDPSNGFDEVNGSYSGILAESNYTTISYNSIENTGYDGIVCGGQGLRVQYNYIASTNLNKADGGAIYSYRGSSTDKLIDHNIILNLPSLVYGLTSPLTDGANAIYLDGSCFFTVTNNTIAYVGGKGIYVNSNHNNTVENNTFYECLYGVFVFSEPDRTAEVNGVDGHARNHVIRYNTVVANASTSDQTVLEIQTKNDESDLSQFGMINYNYYASPSRADDYIRRWYNAWNWTPVDTYVKNINIAELRTNYGYDVNSTMFSTTITDVKKIRFEYNATNVNKIVTLDAGYIDVKGTKYSGNITLLPYTSVVLLPDGTQVATPTFSPVAGTYTSTQSVTISTTTSGATIRYTTDGSTPTSSSTLYSSPVSVSVTTTLNAIGIKSGLTDSSVGTAAYTINAGGGTNIAQGKTATQSSTYLTCVASRTVDGSTNGAGEAYISHTNSDAQAWWMVDLGANYNIGDIKVWNRTDGEYAMSRLSDYYVRVLNSSQVEVWSNHQTTYPNPTTTVNAGGITGRYVKVQLTGTNYLHMAEVQVYESSGGTVGTPTFTKYDANSEIINLYPNPNDGHFSIAFINPLQNEKNEVVITDLAGKQVYVGSVSKEETLKQFDLSNIKSGIYIMMIKDKEKILVTKKFNKN